MSILIDREKCIGCGSCSEVCPGTLIKLDNEGKAFIKYPESCWGCTSCLKECPVFAVRFYIGADIGGAGSFVHTEQNGDILSWIIDRPDGKTVTIDIDRRESNKY
ncbi:MAG: ferredoxin family protein [Oscillospiraceae bacterium]|nr:ferredoxin family protein [Oscillospiraceae bacterium]